jgi:hypothetical protein
MAVYHESQFAIVPLPTARRMFARANLRLKKGKFRDKLRSLLRTQVCVSRKSISKLGEKQILFGNDRRKGKNKGIRDLREFGPTSLRDVELLDRNQGSLFRLSRICFVKLAQASANIALEALRLVPGLSDAPLAIAFPVTPFQRVKKTLSASSFKERPPEYRLP